MPVYNKLPFRRRKADTNIGDNELVWFIECTNEVFTDYEEFFDRYIKLNSMCWTCAVTGKTGMTFEEALESERSAVAAIAESFPRSLATPFLWFAHKYCYRGRLDDLVNDVYVASRDRYFTGEIVWYQKSDAVRVKGIIVSVEYDPSRGINAKKRRSTKAAKEESDGEGGEDHESGQSPAKKKVLKPEDPELPAPDCYLYHFRSLKDDENDEDAVVTDVTYKQLGRPKAVGSRVKVRLYLKTLTELKGDRVIVKKNIVDSFKLDSMNFHDFFVGPLPVFPQTPRRKGFNSSIPEKRKKSPVVEVAEPPQKRKRVSQVDKKKKLILEQQEMLSEVIEQAKTMGVENVSHWEQTERLLTDSEIENLKETVRAAREAFREQERERKRKEKEELLAQKKPRDDLLCDNLECLPELKALELPSFVSEEAFGEALSLSQFFMTFSDHFPSGSETVTLKDCISALCGGEMSNRSLVKILMAFLSARATVIQQEEGDEVNFDKADEMSNETYNVLNHRVHGEEILKVNKRHEKYREIHGVGPTLLPIDWRTISEVLRLNLITSGYCPMGSVYPNRASHRGGIQCYEDPVYMYLLEDPGIAEKLEKGSLFDLTLSERLVVFSLLRDQLLTFGSYRETQEDRIIKMPELRRQIKHLRIFDQEQEKNARIAGYTSEDEVKDKKNQKDKNVVKLRAYLKAVYEGRRVMNADGCKDIILAGIPYDEFDADEIKELRGIQKQVVTEKEEAITAEIFELFGKIGNGFLGRDRAFRTYYYFDNHKILLVENPDDPGVCETETPLRDACSNPQAERIRLMCCTGSPDCCPVHTTKRPKWLYFAMEGGVDQLIEACNSRGFREIDLAETLTIFKPWISAAVDSLACKIAEGVAAIKEEPEEVQQNGHLDIPMQNGLAKDAPSPVLSDHEKSETPETNGRSTRLKKTKKTHLITSGGEFLDLFSLPECTEKEDFSTATLEQNVRELILDMEERLFTRAVGAINLNEGQTRDQFRQAIVDDTDMKQFFTEADCSTHCALNDTLISAERLESMQPAGLDGLMLALIKIIHGVKLKFIKEPFTQTKTEKREEFVIPCQFFFDWQKAILEIKSMSSLALFSVEFDDNVLWNNIKSSVKCYTCRRKGAVEDLVLCEECGCQFHLNCAQPPVTSRADWVCKVCLRRSSNKKRKAEQKAEQKAASSVVKDEGEALENSEELNMDDVYETNDDNNSSTENQEETRTRRKRAAAMRKNYVIADYYE